MTDYTNLVKALRICTGKDDSLSCIDCPYHEEYYPGSCHYEASSEAAAAIEALQSQLPKRGEWKITTERFTPELICSECGVHIPCVAGWCMDVHMNYCPNCGAKMEVHE